MSRIAFLTMDSLADFVSYDQLVIDLLHSAAIQVDEVSWRKPRVNWDDYSLVIIRSPWDYQQQPEAFLEVLETIERSSATLLNPLATVRWNIRKHYLRDLEAQGIRIVPTLWMNAPAISQLRNAFETLQTDELVGKPLIGANADHAWRLHRSAPDSRFAQAAAAWATGTALIQPFVPSIQTDGEISLIWFDGQFSHAVRKVPAPGDFRVQEEHGAQITPCQPPADTLQLAADCHKLFPQTLLYSRVDVVRLPSGQPAIMEIELIEPSLYLAFNPQAPQTFASVIRKRLADPPVRKAPSPLELLPEATPQPPAES